MARKRGTIKERSPGTFLVRVFLGRNAKGKRQYASKTVHGTRKDAQRARTEMLYEIDQGTFVGPNTTTVKGYCKAYIDGKDNITPRTRKGYHSRMRLDIYPEFGSAKLQDLTRVELQAHFTGELKKRLSARTRQYTYMIFNQILEQARKDGLIRENPMEDVERPEVRRKDKVHTIQPFTEDEMEQFLDRTQEHRHWTLWLFLLTTGCRPSEALALEWDNVYLDDETPYVMIEQGVSEDEEGELEIGGVKTESSVRRVSIPRKLVRALEAHRGRQAASMMRRGYRTSLVFPNKAGNILDISRLRYHWKRCCERAEVPEIRLYDARHTHATWLLNHSVNPKVASRRLGHSSTHMFLDVYAHVTKEAEDAALGTLNAAFG